MVKGDKPYKRKNIALEPPFRIIQQSDASKAFVNELTATNNVNLSNILTENKGRRYVIVAEFEAEVLAFIVLWDHGTYFEVELVEANRAVRTEIKGGAALLDLIEDLSKGLGYGMIVLYSIQSRVSYYRNRGYEQVEGILEDPVYGILTKMVKHL